MDVWNQRQGEVIFTRRNLPPMAGLTVASVTVTVRRPVPEPETALSDPTGTVVAPPMLCANGAHEPASRADDSSTM